jgi:hypothetical protein
MKSAYIFVGVFVVLLFSILIYTNYLKLKRCWHCYNFEGTLKQQVNKKCADAIWQAEGCASAEYPKSLYSPLDTYSLLKYKAETAFNYYGKSCYNGFD